MDHFVSIAFEEASRQHLARLARLGEMPFLPEKIGAWWERDTEIDVLAISRTEKQALVGECKWSVNPVGVNILDELKQRAQALLREGEVLQLHYALFSRAGFTPALEFVAQAEGVRLYRVDEIVGAG